MNDIKSIIAIVTKFAFVGFKILWYLSARNKVHTMHLLARMQEVEDTNLTKDDSTDTTMLAYTYKKHEYEKNKDARVARF
jgi:hypothetical protein